MSLHTLAPSTSTVELTQVLEINDRLRSAEAAGAWLVTADLLGLTGATVLLRALDRAATLVIPQPERRREPSPLPGRAALRRLLATGAPTAPYLYGVFTEAPSGGRRELPVTLHTDHLRSISCELEMRRHRWGV